ncbi:MAG: CBS domain-containing protein [Cyanobacteriota bacterium]|jgi:CBS domain-containing protein
MKAQDIMTTPVVTIRGSATVAEAAQKLKENGLRALIVERRHPEDAYGIVTETDIVCKVAAYGADPKITKVYEIMTKPCVVVNPELQVEYVARLFAQTRIHCAPVIRGDLLGIVTVGDILNRGDFIERPKAPLLEEQLQTALANARRLSAEQSPDSAAAWDIVEEIQAELSHQRAQKPPADYFAEYCADNPDAPEARIYDS